MKINNKRKTMSYLAGFAALAMPACLSAQVSVTASAGTAGPTTYTSVNAAFGAINAGTHAGVIAIVITANTTEPATPIPLLASGGTATYTSISLKPSGGSFTVNSAAAPIANRGIIELAGADNVTIDGDDLATPGTQNLSIIANTVTTAGVACIRLSSNSTTGTDGTDNNTVKNCIIAGSRSSATSNVVNYAIQFSNGTGTSAEATGAYSSLNTTIQNNMITRCFYGIHAIGNSVTYLNTGIKISGNTIGSATPADYVAFRGIDVSYSSVTGGAGAALINNNDVRTGQTSATANISSIELGAANTGVLVTRNNIHESINTSSGVWGMWGIGITSATSNSSITITNNFIRDMQGSLGITIIGNQYGGHGIFVNAAATGIIINNNTIVQSGATMIGTCIQVNATGATVAQMLNNILVNTVPSAYACAFYVTATTNISAAAVNNNNYAVANGITGYYTTNQLTLASWKTATGKDANSYNEMPAFVSATDLHIVPSLNPTFLESTGALVSVTGVADDIDSQVRPGPVGSVNGGGTAPDIGADEFDGKPVTCFPAVSATVSSITHSTAVISWSPGAIIPAAWQLYFGSAPLSPPVSTTIPSAISTTATYTLTGLTASTGYSVYIRAFCGGNDNSQWLLVSPFMTKCLPPASPVVTPGAVCGAGTVSLNASSTAGTQVYWYTNPTGNPVASGTTFVTPTLSANVTYYAASMSGSGTFTAGISYSSSNSTSGSGTGTYGNYFNALSDFIINSVVVYPQSSTGNTPGTITIGIIDPAGNILQQATAPVVGYPQTAGNLQPQTIPLNFVIAPGTNYRMVLLSYTGISNLMFTNSGLTYPYTVPNVISFTSGTYSGGLQPTLYYYFYNWQIQAGCLSTQVVPVIATVNYPPSLLAFSAANGTVCAGTPVNLLSVGSSASVTWTPSGERTSNITVTPAVNTTYTVTGEIVAGCTRTAVITVPVKPSPVVVASAVSTVVCAGETASLSAQGTASTYVWTPNAGTGIDIYVTPIVNTNYTVTGYGNNGCPGTATVAINVNPAPEVSIAASRQVICKGETTSLYAITSATSFAWSNGGAASTTTVAPAANTTYSVVADDGTCPGVAFIVIIIETCTGIQNNTAANDIAVYPNPVREVLNVSVPSAFAGNANVYVYDATGRLVTQQAITGETTTVSFAHLDNGIYFFKISDNNNEIKTGRIIKQ